MIDMNWKEVQMPDALQWAVGRTVDRTPRSYYYNPPEFSGVSVVFFTDETAVACQSDFSHGYDSDPGAEREPPLWWIGTPEEKK